jgi:O-antigen/teichoic acid export membrane protein
MNKSKLIVKNFILLFTSNVIGQVFYLGGLVHLARVFGPGGFGLWNFAQAWLIYLFRGGEMGLETLGVREIARNPADTPRLISAVVFSRVLLLIILFIIIITVVLLGIIPSDTAPILLTFSLVLIPMAFILEWVFEGHQTIWSVSIARAFKGFLFFLPVIIFVRSSNELILSALFYVISLTLPICYIGWYTIKCFNYEKIRNIYPLLPRIWKSALPIGLSALLSNYNLFLGTMVIGYTMQHDYLGYYTASHRIILFLWAYIISNLQRVVLPTLSHLHHASIDSFKSFVESFLRYASVISGGIGLILFFLSNFIIRIIYSDRYILSSPILQILGWAFALASIRMILEMALLASDRQRFYFKGMVILSIIYSTFTPILVFCCGIDGAAYAAIIAEGSYSAFLVTLWCRENRSDIWMVLLKPLIAAAVVTPVLMYFSMSTIFNVILASCGYIAILFFSKAFTYSEFTKMFVLLKKRND